MAPAKKPAPKKPAPKKPAAAKAPAPKKPVVVPKVAPINAPKPGTLNNLKNARKAAEGVDKWRAQGGAPQSARQRANRAPATVPKVDPINAPKPGTLNNLKNARKAADGVDKWRAQGGAPQSANARRTANRATVSGSKPVTAPSIPKAAAPKAPARPGGALRGARSGNPVVDTIGAAVGAALSPLAFEAGKALGNAIKRTSEKRPAPGGSTTKSQTIGDGTKGGGLDKNRPAPRKPKPVGNIPPGEGTGRGSPNDPPRRASTSGSGSSTGGRSSGGGSSTLSRPSARPAAPAMPSAVTKATPAAAAPKPASKGPNIGPTADGASYGKAVKLQSKIDGTSDNDMKRRRAFLDAKDSMAGAKAVRELQEKRKKKLSGMLSSETTIAPSKQQS